MLYIHSFSTHYQHSLMNGEQHKKHLNSQSGHYSKYRMFYCWSAHPSHGCVAWSWCITSDYASVLAILNTLGNTPRKRIAEEMPMLALHLPKSNNALTANYHLCSSGERNTAQRRTMINIGRTMMQALELLQLAKRHILEWICIELWRNQACSYSHYQVRLVWGN